MKKWLGFALKAGISIGILAVIALRTDVSRIGTLLVSVNSRTIAAVLALMIVQTVLTGYRWVLVMDVVGVFVGFWPALQAIYVSLLLNQCLPSFVGADAYRAYWLYRESNRLGPAVRSVVLDRIVAMIALIIMLAAGIGLLFQRLGDTAAKGGLAVLLGCGIVGTIVFFTCDALPKRWQRIRVIGELATLSASGRALLLSGPTGITVVAVAILVHVISAVVMFSFASDLALPLTLRDCVLFIAPISLLSAVPISVAGWGVREGVVVGALSLVGIGTEPALALSVLFGVTQLANGLLGVLPLAFGEGRYLPVRAQYGGPAALAERVP
jgi:uncharacterized membrane protein YbhN (UPF0104 family)